MKLRIVTIILVTLILHDLFGKILNGYEKELTTARASIARLRQLLAGDQTLSNEHRQRVNNKIVELEDFLVYHQLTDTLLEKFRQIAPDIYAAIDTLADHRGRAIDVYVKFIPRYKARTKSFGIAMLAVSEDDLCTSPHGKGSVAVEICILNNALAILSHEFGHLQYMVPNLQKYLQDYAAMYRRATSDRLLGHDCGDAGGRNALRFESRFRQHYRRFIRADAGEKVFPFAYLRPMRNRIAQEFGSATWELAGNYPPIF